MTVYLDTSVVLSRFLGQPNALRSWGTWDRVFTSVLMRAEFFRTLDRLRLENSIDDSERVALSQHFFTLWEATYRIPLSPAVLERAAEPFPTVLGTLDALHLASALVIARAYDDRPTLLTHDRQLSQAANALGLPTEGT